jgi:hypothetical protein
VILIPSDDNGHRVKELIDGLIAGKTSKSQVRTSLQMKIFSGYLENRACAKSYTLRLSGLKFLKTPLGRRVKLFCCR